VVCHATGRARVWYSPVDDLVVIDHDLDEAEVAKITRLRAAAQKAAQRPAA
jgi:hypothetical protein